MKAVKNLKTNPDKSAFKCWLIGKFYHLQILFTSITFIKAYFSFPITTCLFFPSLVQVITVNLSSPKLSSTEVFLGLIILHSLTAYTITHLLYNKKQVESL